MWTQSTRFLNPCLRGPNTKIAIAFDRMGRLPRPLGYLMWYIFAMGLYLFRGVASAFPSSGGADAFPLPPALVFGTFIPFTQRVAHTFYTLLRADGAPYSGPRIAGHGSAGFFCSVGRSASGPPPLLSPSTEGLVFHRDTQYLQIPRIYMRLL